MQFEEELIKALNRGTGYEEGKQRIVKMFGQDLRKTERVKMIKDEFGSGGYSSPGASVLRWGYGVNGFEVSLAAGKKRRFTWNEVHDKIKELIEQGAY